MLLGIGLASTQSHASVIQSITIEEIGIVSGGLGASLISSGGGQFSFVGGIPKSFGSAGSADGAILMGLAQGDGAFTPGFDFAPGIFIKPNTVAGAASAMVDGDGDGDGKLVLDLSGWGANVSLGLGYFPLPPDNGTLITNLSAKDASSYYYTADWSHKITANDDPSGMFIGFHTLWHLEGVATVPEPGTAWLVGATLIGLLGGRRRKLL
jgi:hypothetical protein